MRNSYPMLTEPEVRAAEPRDEKPYKLADGEGRYQMVTLTAGFLRATSYLGTAASGVGCDKDLLNSLGVSCPRLEWGRTSL